MLARAQLTQRRSWRLWRSPPPQIGYYFGPHLAYFNVQVRDSKPYRDGNDAALRAVDLPGNTQVYLVGMPVHDQNVPRDWLGFLSRDRDARRFFPLLSVSPDTISPKFLIDLPPGVNYAFFVDPNDVNAMNRSIATCQTPSAAVQPLGYSRRTKNTCCSSCPATDPAAPAAEIAT